MENIIMNKTDTCLEGLPGRYLHFCSFRLPAPGHYAKAHLYLNLTICKMPFPHPAPSLRIFTKYSSLLFISTQDFPTTHASRIDLHSTLDCFLSFIDYLRYFFAEHACAYFSAITPHISLTDKNNYVIPFPGENFFPSYPRAVTTRAREAPTFEKLITTTA
ncbi:unnamed protein product [Fusarium venenatum]|uniref:Uncharacterized protein n=1 Tax=Fusarium venenatum TaxID=56646 RepID=A0A2L2TSY1_9HYPO|nr:uncharacterized protein FVRRES_00812 [Fusarium venenatum]CEI64300.1 unnamed protein product [Fusarium venenatum]